MIPGEYLLSAEPIAINAGRRVATLEVTNRGDRPVQVGSHCHFFEVNRCLAFDRERAYGMRLDIAAGTAVRFEPGDTCAVDLVAIGGARRVSGLNRLVEGSLDDPSVKARAMERMRAFMAGGHAVLGGNGRGGRGGRGGNGNGELGGSG